MFARLNLSIRARSRTRRFFSGVMLALWVTSVVGCGDAGTPALTRLREARKLTAELRVELARTGDAANRAVMADTDETSKLSADEAERAGRAAQQDLELLEPLVRGLDFSEESALLKTFRATFARYRLIDRELLTLAVENTNLKAQRLSFGAAHQAADALQAALEPVLGDAGHTEALLRARELALRTLLAVRELQVLEAPHIAESDDGKMDQLEQQMTTREQRARASLEELASAKDPSIAGVVPSARAALGRFDSLHAEIIRLSRRNSNVRSLALSLGEKRRLAGVCESSLRELGARLEKRTFPATR